MGANFSMLMMKAMAQQNGKTGNPNISAQQLPAFETFFNARQPQDRKSGQDFVNAVRDFGVSNAPQNVPQTTAPGFNPSAQLPAVSTVNTPNNQASMRSNPLDSFLSQTGSPLQNEFNSLTRQRDNNPLDRFFEELGGIV